MINEDSVKRYLEKLLGFAGAQVQKQKKAKDEAESGSFLDRLEYGGWRYWVGYRSGLVAARKVMNDPLYQIGSAFSEYRHARNNGV